MGFLRLTAWLVALVLVLGIAVNLLQYVLPPPQEQSPWDNPRLGVPAPRTRLVCPEDCPERGVYVIRLYPRLVVNYYGLAVEGNGIVLRYTNTTAEAFRALSKLLEPTTYYYYYSILTALVAFSTGREGAVYALHPLPLSEDDAENLTATAIYVCGPSAPVYVPGVRPALLANSSVEIDRGYLYFPGLGFWAEVPVVWNVVTYAPTAEVSFEVSREVVGEVSVEGFAEVEVSAEVLEERLCRVERYYVVKDGVEYLAEERHYCALYSVSYGYRLGYTYGNTTYVVEERYGSLEYGTDPDDSSREILLAEGGYYRGVGPLASAGVSAVGYSDYACHAEVGGTCVNATVKHLAEFRPESNR